MPFLWGHGSFGGNYGSASGQLTSGFQLVGNAIPIDSVPQNVAYLKEAIQKKMGVTGQLAQGCWPRLGNGYRSADR